MPKLIGRVPFTDGVTRDVFEDRAGGRYVIGPDGKRVEGVWLLALAEADVPHIVESDGTMPAKASCG
jgi:hypothetical protein